MGLKIKVTNRVAYTFIAIGILIAIAFAVNAYNSGGPPNIVGHSAEELDLGPITIDDANNRIGINEPSPFAALDVNGGIMVDSILSQEIYLPFGGGCYYLAADGSGKITCLSSTPDPYDIGGSGSPGGGYWLEGATAGEIYYNDGNVGIGTSDPAANLHLSGSSGREILLTGTSMNPDSTLRLMAVTSNGVTESQIQFEEVLRLVEGIGGAGQSELEIRRGQVFLKSGILRKDSGNDILEKNADGDIILTLG